MSPPVTLIPDPDPVSLLEWVDEVADRFETDSQRGTRSPLADYLGDSTGERRVALARELVRIDMERRRKAGEVPHWQDYTGDVPELLGPDPEQGDLLESARGSGGVLNGHTTFYTGPIFRRPGQGPHFPAIRGFEILGVLGAGGMGTVYKARQDSLKRLVALKVIRGEVLARGAQSRARFRAEAEAAAALQHPNIVHIYEVGQQDGLPYIALEFVDGGSLAQKLGGKPLPPEQAARLAQTLARAMEFAHRHGIIHRDLKPANILLQMQNAEGRRQNEKPGFASCALHAEFCIPKIADFGLAKQADREEGNTLSGAILGTPSYMAPEQAEGKAREAGPAADIYALGAILYEMLTGVPPFRGATQLETLERVRSEEPIRPTHLQPRLPRDLETICLKAMAKAPARRYATAGELAEDLGRFLSGSPIRARPVGFVERTWRYCLRRPWQALLAAAAAVIVALILGGSVYLAWAGEARDRDLRRESLVQQLQLVRAYAHGNGWSDQAWGLVREAVRLRPDGLLADQAAASCAELDARVHLRLEKLSVSALAFAGPALLLGGRGDEREAHAEGAKLWDTRTGAVRVFRQGGYGPVAPGGGDRLLHLVARPGPAVELWDLARQKSEGPWRFADRRVTTFALNELGWPALALTPDGTRAAAAATGPEGRGAVAVWDTQSGRPLLEVAVQAAALALAPGGSLLAVSDPEGLTTVWSVPGGKPVGTFRASRTPVQALAFDPAGKRLARGDAAGVLSVWDLEAGIPVCYCHGSHPGVYALAFSPDGTLLASGGQGPAQLWDAATGRSLLRLQTSGQVTGLCFAADGRQLAVGTRGPATATLWDLENGRGIRGLRGLAGQVARLCFSGDGRLLAALAPGGRVALWDLEGGSLLRVLEAARKDAAEAALAFSPDGLRLACAGPGEARLWETGTGKELGTWKLPPGMHNALAFRPSGPLLLFREEAGDGAARAGQDGRPGSRRVCRIRNLLGERPGEAVAEVTAFNRHFLGVRACPGGECFLAEGVAAGADGTLSRSVRAFDALTGEEKWSLPTFRTPLEAALTLDPTGRLLAVRTGNRDDQVGLVDVASGKVLEAPGRFPVCLGPEMTYFVQVGSRSPGGPEGGYALYRKDDATPRVVLGLDAGPSAPPSFDPTGRLLAWPQADGTVCVCHVEELRGRLAAAGLDWKAEVP